jgi:deoxyribodipyrimidine photolyase-like uncharacterized protein
MRKEVSSNSSSNTDKIREEGVKVLYESLKKNHPHTTLEDCYQIYDKMQHKNKESDNLREEMNN